MTSSGIQKINSRKIIESSPNFETLFKSNLRKLPEKSGVLGLHSHKQSYDTYISKNGADFDSELRDYDVFDNSTN